MATTRKTYRAAITASMAGDLPRPNFEGAVRRAQTKNAPKLLSAAKALARARMKQDRSRDWRGRPKNAQSMLEGYEARLIEGGRTISLRNRFLRGRVFEAGSKRHPITARRRPLLAFRGEDGGLRRPRSIDHPGQRGRYPMRDAVRARSDEMAAAIREEVDREMG